MRTIVIGSKEWHHYKDAYRYQTPELVREKIERFGRLDHGEMTLWQALERCSALVDPSDPDLDEGNDKHGWQTAESLRRAYPSVELDWLHLVGLIHDLGKVLSGSFGEPTWAVVGDTFVVNEKPPPPPGTHIDDVLLSWGHDYYLYLVLKAAQSSLPPVALDIIRYHSFYEWHTEGRYNHLSYEPETLEWVRRFNEHDLHSKQDQPVSHYDKPYYQSLIAKYFPNGDVLKW